MRKIVKIDVPEGFARWVKQKPNDKTENQWFQELYEQKKWEVVSALSNHNSKEQFYLCAYCCDRISGELDDTVNEHVEARRIAPRRSLDYTNIVASCKKRYQCDASHKDQSLPLTPFMDECDIELKFKISGRVEGTTDRAVESIRVLNLGDTEKNNKAIIEKRKQLANNLMWLNGINPEDGLEDEELLSVVIEDLLRPKNGELEPFSPVVANILRNWISA
jgi:uncharacterized protein (TIGR02646 family)